jgi:hypothetical protein
LIALPQTDGVFTFALRAPASKFRLARISPLKAADKAGSFKGESKMFEVLFMVVALVVVAVPLLAMASSKS